MQITPLVATKNHLDTNSIDHVLPLGLGCFWTCGNCLFWLRWTGIYFALSPLSLFGDWSILRRIKKLLNFSEEQHTGSVFSQWHSAVYTDSLHLSCAKQVVRPGMWWLDADLVNLRGDSWPRAWLTSTSCSPVLEAVSRRYPQDIEWGRNQRKQQKDLFDLHPVWRTTLPAFCWLLLFCLRNSCQDGGNLSKWGWSTIQSRFNETVCPLSIPGASRRD